MKRFGLGLGLALALAGCGSDPDTQDCTIDPPGALLLTSTSFAACATIPAAQACAGVNKSPDLAWSGAPSATQSFAVVMTDLSAPPPLVHWVIYDIPAVATGLPAAVANSYEPDNVPGAHQTFSFDNQSRGYRGPCPPIKHTYEFAVHALDVAILPGATMQTARAEAIELITAHQLATATLSGTYSP